MPLRRSNARSSRPVRPSTATWRVTRTRSRPSRRRDSRSLPTMAAPAATAGPCSAGRDTPTSRTLRATRIRGGRRSLARRATGIRSALRRCATLPKRRLTSTTGRPAPYARRCSSWARHSSAAPSTNRRSTSWWPSSTPLPASSPTCPIRSSRVGPRSRPMIPSPLAGRGIIITCSGDRAHVGPPRVCVGPERGAQRRRKTGDTRLTRRVASVGPRGRAAPRRAGGRVGGRVPPAARGPPSRAIAPWAPCRSASWGRR